MMTFPIYGKITNVPNHQSDWSKPSEYGCSNHVTTSVAGISWQFLLAKAQVWWLLTPSSLFTPVWLCNAPCMVACWLKLSYGVPGDQGWIHNCSDISSQHLVVLFQPTYLYLAGKYLNRTKKMPHFIKVYPNHIHHVGHCFTLFQSQKANLVPALPGQEIVAEAADQRIHQLSAFFSSGGWKTLPGPQLLGEKSPFSLWNTDQSRISGINPGNFLGWCE